MIKYINMHLFELIHEKNQFKWEAKFRNINYCKPSTRNFDVHSPPQLLGENAGFIK